ncbi:unnamed protein product [Ilex paraguariensis]|uniref:Uncharacterized protein n=1 Tax=Ilex paraguariensis TaxID=185542 RepID=A0ABC8QPF6_9AQUA
MVVQSTYPQISLPNELVSSTSAEPEPILVLSDDLVDFSPSLQSNIPEHLEVMVPPATTLVPTPTNKSPSRSEDSLTTISR